jgi:flagellar capping protein FliD
MPAMREAWTDERLDDLNAKVDRGFDRLDARFDRVDERFERMEERMDTRFERMEERFDSLQRTMIQGGVVVIAALIGLIATQL